MERASLGDGGSTMENKHDKAVPHTKASGARERDARVRANSGSWSCRSGSLALGAWARKVRHVERYAPRFYCATTTQGSSTSRVVLSLGLVVIVLDRVDGGGLNVASCKL